MPHEFTQNAISKPWKIDENERLPVAIIIDDENGEGVAELGARNQWNMEIARYICNLHNSTLNALKPKEFKRICDCEKDCDCHQKD